jgi:hypothetical protein
VPDRRSRDVLLVAHRTAPVAEQSSASTQQTSATAQQIAAPAVDLSRTSEALEGAVQAERLGHITDASAFSSGRAG